MKIRFKVGLALAGLAMISTMALAGLWPGLPIVGIGSVCWGSATTTAGITGCPNTAPAGPTIVTGNELVPADIYNSTTGRPGNPSTVLLSLASLNSLPLSFMNVAPTTLISFTATNTMGGLQLASSAGISILNIALPPLPIDGQQFVLNSNRGIQVINITGGGVTSNIAANSAPTVLTPSLTGPQGYRFRYNLADQFWYRLQ